jgi:hypothetical protein
MPLATPSRNQTECDQWHQVKQNYADLVDSKTRVMNCIKGLNRELKPTAMHSVHPVMGKDKDAELDEQNHVVNPNTPEKNVLDLIRRHNTPPITKRKNIRVNDKAERLER